MLRVFCSLSAQGRLDHGLLGSRGRLRPRHRPDRRGDRGRSRRVPHALAWQRPLDRAPNQRRVGQSLSGGHRLALWIAAQSACYPSGIWGTYRHWQALGAQVRKGERATTVVFWKEVGSARSGDDGEDESERRRFLARGYCVFNQAQVDNYEAETPALLPEAERIAQADAFYAHLGISTVHGGREACFLPARDRIHMPAFEAFENPAAYYSVLYHEATHATAAAHRVGRDLSGRFGSEAYAVEEIVADAGACMVLADLGIAAQPRPDHAAYIASWLTLWPAGHNVSNREQTIM